MRLIFYHDAKLIFYHDVTFLFYFLNYVFCNDCNSFFNYKYLMEHLYYSLHIFQHLLFIFKYLSHSVWQSIYKCQIKNNKFENYAVLILERMSNSCKYDIALIKNSAYVSIAFLFVQRNKRRSRYQFSLFFCP